MVQLGWSKSENSGWVWVNCSYPVFNIGLARILEGKMRVHTGRNPPNEDSHLLVAIVAAEATDVVSAAVDHVRLARPEAPVLLFDTRIDLPLARAALRAGARGFIHAGMTPQQIVRAVEVAAAGELVAPRKLLEELVTGEGSTDLEALSHRQREILGLVAEGRSNAQIAAHLYLSESTVKQHLRAAYKLLGVRNRGEAARLVRINEDPH